MSMDEPCAAAGARGASVNTTARAPETRTVTSTSRGEDLLVDVGSRREVSRTGRYHGRSPGDRFVQAQPVSPYPLHRRVELGKLDRLADAAVRARQVALRQLAGLGGRNEDDDGNGGGPVARTHGTHHVGRVQLRKPEIEQHEAGRRSAEAVAKSAAD